MKGVRCVKADGARMLVRGEKEKERKKGGERCWLLSCSQKKNLGYISHDVEAAVYVYVKERGRERANKCLRVRDTHLLARTYTHVSCSSPTKNTNRLVSLSFPSSFFTTSFFLLFSGSFLIAFQRSEDDLSCLLLILSHHRIYLLIPPTVVAS